MRQLSEQQKRFTSVVASSVLHHLGIELVANGGLESEPVRKAYENFAGQPVDEPGHMILESLSYAAMAGAESEDIEKQRVRDFDHVNYHGAELQMETRYKDRHVM